ncbi:RNA polymerase sigma-70 factor [Pedobacter immunditicola]|uniref:RNA polymerase sigma-70 factor n=1 Tax=Pedobacter immunditicola TaxID=3133440 RepID=UPI00309F8494
MEKDLNYKPEDVFKEYYGRLSYFAFQFVNDQSVAEDFVQDAFVAYWDSKKKVSDHPQAVKDFLYTAVRNSSLNFLKRKKVQERYFFLRNDEKFENQKVLETMIQAEAMANLHQAISQLPESCRKVFLLAYFQGLSNPEIAQELKISINTVRNHKYNGLKILRANLDVKTFMAFMVIMAS